MRITHNMMTRNYLSNLNKNLKNLSKSNDKLSSQRSFNRAYENIGDANRVLRTRKLLDDNERALTTIDTVAGRYSAAEDGLSAANDTLLKVTDLVMKSVNGTYSEADRKIMANEINNLQEQLFQISNSKFSDKYIYGASGNKAGAAPFTTDPMTGRLFYQGVDVDSMVVGADGKPYLPDGVTKIPFNDDNYIDIGLGYTVENGKVDPRTAVKSTFSGVELFGFGTTADGLPNNLFSLLGKMSNDIAAGNTDEVSRDFTHLQKRQESLLTNIANIGSLTSYVEQTQERLENDKINLQTVQNGLEAVDLSQEIMYNKDFEMSWMVTLQLGSKIIPPSIFDFIR